MILAADVGGTKTVLGLFRVSRGKLTCVRSSEFGSQKFPSFEAIVRSFLSQSRHKVKRCVVGVAGPVVDGSSQVVNLRWPISVKRLATELRTAEVLLINDVEATAWGVAELPRRQLVNLTPGVRRRPGNAALVAAGTGLGMALMVWDGRRYHRVPSEGGHQDFAPRDDLEIALLRFLRRRHGRVSIERLVAGPGFSAIYQFLTENGWGKESNLMSRRLAETDDPNRAISEAGLRGEDPVAKKTVEMFTSLYGAVAGDLALTARATGGVFVGGGIAPKILPVLQSGEFVRAFRNKGRLTPLLERIPVHVIREPRTALIGAAACAADRFAPPRPQQLRRGARTK